MENGVQVNRLLIVVVGASRLVQKHSPLLPRALVLSVG